MVDMKVADVENAVAARKQYHQELAEYCKVMYDRQAKGSLETLAEMRKLPVEILEELGIFYVGSMAEMLLPQYVKKIKEFGLISENNGKPIFHERWAIPIRDTDGLVMNLVGYSPNFDERYLYGTGKYYSRKDTLWGLEKMDMAYEKGYAVITEGITDAIRLRSLGIENAFARCGTMKSDYVIQQLSRFKYGVILIHDRDEAGDGTREHWRPSRYIRLNTFLAYKDSDEMLREPENVDWFMEYFNEAVRRLMAGENTGVECALESLTMQ